MKRSLYKTVFAGFLFLSTLFLATSCSDSSDDFVETAWNIENFTVNASQWSWNSNLSRWEAVRPLSNLDEFIYENGVVLGFIFIGTQGTNEVQIQLPYVKSYLFGNGNNGDINFTETISMEYSLQRKEVTFIIEPSDGFQDQDSKQNYNFRIAMIW